MRRPALLAIALTAAFAAPALAHQGNPNFESLVRSVDGAPGLHAEVLNGDDRLLLVNRSRHTIVVEGYDHEPYARLLPDRTVQVNDHSPARYLNDDRFGQVDVPASASKDAEPAWRVVGHDGSFEFHDHRIHWMSKGTPPQVTDESDRAKVTDWTVPLRVDDRPAAVRGTLWWRGTGASAPVGAFVGLGAFALLGAMLVVLVRRRRRGAGAHPAAEEREAW